MLKELIILRRYGVGVKVNVLSGEAESRAWSGRIEARSE